MIIKLLEQPIISIGDAKLLGLVKGLALEEDRAAGVYALADDVCLAVALDNAFIGPDAVMVPDMDAVRLSQVPSKALVSMTEVFNHQGVHMGSLVAVEVDEAHRVVKLYTDRYEFEYSKVTKAGDIIVADVSEYEIQIDDDPMEQAEKEVEKLRSKVDSYLEYNVGKVYKSVKPALNENIDEDASSIGIESSTEELPAAAEPQQQAAAVSELKTPLRPVQEFSHNEDAVSGANFKENDVIDKKYKYLCGKKLLEDIDIEGKSFAKDSVIDDELIKCAVANNSIVKVIMNAED